MKLLRMALLFARRESRSSEFRLLTFALLLAVATTTTISLFSDRLGRALLTQSAELMGGDLVLQSSRPPQSLWMDFAVQSGLETTELVEFGTVLVGGEHILLASVKAAGEGYPLRGQLRVADHRYAKDYGVSHRPGRGEVWADQRVLDRLEIAVGDVVGIGAMSFTVTRVLTFEPDRGTDFFNLSPRVLINLDDLEETRVIQPGSRVRYRYLYAGEGVAAFADWLKPRLGPAQKLLDVRSDKGAASKALINADRYLRLIAMMAVLLASVAIAVTAREYSDRQLDVSAMLRCLGASQQRVMGLYLVQLLLVAILAGVLGCVLGWGVHMGLLSLLSELLPARLPQAGLAPLLTGFATGFIILCGTALPPLLKLKQVPPLRVMRRDLAPNSLSAWTLYSVALLALVLLVLLLSREVWLTLLIFAAAGLLVLLLTVMVYGVLRLRVGEKQVRRSFLGRGFVSLSRRARSNSGQIIAFAIALMLMLIIAQLRTGLLDNWQNQMPEDAPNNFAFNIQPQAAEDFAGFLDSRGVQREPLYPMVRGRLIAINGQPLRSGELDPVGNDESLNRELNLTWSASLPTDNTIVSGSWWNDQPVSTEAVSVEAELAERLGIKMGDQLTFNIAGNQRLARVQSLRTVVWENFSPNFYMIFPPGALDGLPATYITSFRLNDEQRKWLVELVTRFPSVTVLEVEVIIRQIRGILKQVTSAVELMLVFVLMAGIAVLLAAVQSTLGERLREGALMRALGARRQYIALNNLTEFGMLGLLSGLLAVLGAEIVNSFLYGRLFGIDREIVYWVWLALPLAAALLIAIVGYLATRRAVRQSPRSLLQQFNQV